MTNKQKIGFGYSGGVEMIAITPERAEIIRSLSKPNGKPINDRSVIERVMGANTDRYFKYLVGGNNVLTCCKHVLGWTAVA